MAIIVLKYRSGEEMRKGDHVLFHGNPAEVELVACDPNDPEAAWHVQEFGGGVMILTRWFQAAHLSLQTRLMSTRIWNLLRVPRHRKGRPSQLEVCNWRNSPFHSLRFKKANRRRKLALTPVIANYPAELTSPLGPFTGHVDARKHSFFSTCPVCSFTMLRRATLPQILENVLVGGESL